MGLHSTQKKWRDEQLAEMGLKEIPEQRFNIWYVLLVTLFLMVVIAWAVTTVMVWNA